MELFNGGIGANSNDGLYCMAVFTYYCSTISLNISSFFSININFLNLQNSRKSCNLRFSTDLLIRTFFKKKNVKPKTEVALLKKLSNCEFTTKIKEKKNILRKPTITMLSNTVVVLIEHLLFI